MNFLDKLQKQPEHVRKIILWIIVVVVALVLATLWFYSSYWKIKRFQTEEFIEDLKFPKIEIPEINEQ